jgi:2-polyprenyl-6-methoxyphenol hydroxylase-like FAD-dependent oxidoreductase
MLLRQKKSWYPGLYALLNFLIQTSFPWLQQAGVTLLGEAAHAMPTEKGLGGNNVLEDARLLSTLLAASPYPIDWLELIEKYEREMFAKARIAVQESESAAAYFYNLRSRL